MLDVRLSRRLLVQHDVVLVVVVGDVVRRVEEHARQERLRRDHPDDEAHSEQGEQPIAEPRLVPRHHP